jgi:parallel beta-helix repeat protein
MKNFKIFALIIILLITALFVGCIALTTPQLKIGPGSTTEKGKKLKVELDIPYYTAEGIENGCGCAAGAMIMNYYNYLVSPSDIEPYIMVPETKLTDTFGLLPGIIFYIGYYDYNLKTKLKIMKIEQIKEEVGNGNPVAVWQYAWLPRVKENWHYRVIHGYDDEQQEFIISCSLGEDYRMSYEKFISLNVIEKISNECPDGNPCLVPDDKCPSLIIETKGLDIDVDVVPKEGNTPHKVNCVGYVRAGVAPFYYQWDFGDGAWSEKGIGIEYSNVFHTYTNSGKFVPVLYVEDSMGRKGKCKAEDVIVIPTLSGPVHNLTKNTYYNTIQAALDDADNNNTIEVSEGTYNENINFNGKNITLLSTNPNDPDVVASTIIDGGGNGSVVTFTGGETRQAVLRGLTIQNGNSEPGAGGGIIIINSSPTISGNIIRWNNAHSDHGGGGIFIAHSASPFIENNNIYGNQGGYGGGIYVGDNSSPTIRNNTIENNSAEIHRGGGIFISGSSSPTIQDNSFSDNSSQYGGGICIVENSSGEISNNYFTLNIARYGGGIFCGEDSDPIIKQNEFYENSATSFGGGLFIGECVVNNNVITGNTAQKGGGIFVWESSPTISDNTINGNTATMSGGGIYVRSNSHPTINNNIISLNKATFYGGGLCIDGVSSVKTANGTTWPRQNTPPNTEVTNTYSDNTHGNPLDYTEGADVYFE